MKLSSRVKNSVIGVVLFCVSIIVTLFLLELVVRVVYPQSHYAIMSSPWGFQHIPNAKINYYGERGEVGRPRGLVPIQYNSHGLREYEYGYEKPAGVFRILALGDSWAEDMGSYFENLHVKRLEKKLNASGAPVIFEVINAGHYAYDNAQELLYFMLEGRKYRPDIVVIFYSGDTAEPKYATLEGGALKLHKQEFSWSQRIRRTIVSFFRRHSDLGSLVLDRMTGAGGLNSLLVKCKLKDENCYATFPKDHPAVSSITDQGLKEKIVSQASGDFKEVDKQIYLTLKSEVERSGGKFVFLSVNKMDPVKSNFLKEHGFYVLEMDIDFKKMAEMREVDMHAGTYDKTLDSHRFGYKMNEVAAQQMFDFLRKKGLIPG